MAQKLTTGLFITGAAARIAQEVAIIDLLIKNKGLSLNQDNTMLAGFSSGSLNLMAINACFRSNNPLSWDTDYKEQVLFQLRNKDVFSLLPRTHTSLLNTAPLRATLTSFLQEAGFNYYSDLPFRSDVLTAGKNTGQTYWFNNQGNGKDIVAADLFMCSTAIPVAFPAQQLGFRPGSAETAPDSWFVDGGTHGQFINFQTALDAFVAQNGPLEELHVISPMREKLEDDHENLVQALKEGGVKEGLSDLKQDFSINISYNSFVKFVTMLQEQNAGGKYAQNIYVSLPAMNKNSGILDFNHEQDVYNTVTDWMSNQHPEQLAMPLDQYVATHPLKPIINT